MAMDDPDGAVTRHNDLAADLGARLVRGTIGAGGDVIETLIVLESVIAGVCLTLVRLGGDEVVIDALMERVKARVAELRLKDIQTKGSA